MILYYQYIYSSHRESPLHDYSWSQTNNLASFYKYLGDGTGIKKKYSNKNGVIFNYPRNIFYVPSLYF